VSRGALAEFEKALIAERTKAGLAAAKRRGVKVGRKQELTAAQVGHARTLFASGEGARLLLERWGDPGQLSIAPSHDFRNLLDVLEVEPRAM
jgi:DNA invertase Pin-like site-specific DNA recombinase